VPSIEELLALNAELRSEVTALRARIVELEARLNQNPRNSSMPPSLEGLSKPPAKSRAERRSEARRKGKQPGAPGSHLARVVDPDELKTISPDSCSWCGADLRDADLLGVERRQVFDLPDISMRVTEHCVERRRCKCGTETKAEFPDHVTAPACYGPKLRALAVYLAVYQHLPYDRMAKLFSDVLHQPVSTGALQQMVKEAAVATGPFLEAVRTLLADADCVHFDETGARVEGRLHWIHGASDHLLTLLTPHTRRGKVAFEEIGVITKMKGVAVHDGFRPYQSYEVTHSLCNAHHLRELEGCEKPWADGLAELLIEAKDAVTKAKSAGRSSLDQATLDSIIDRYGVLVRQGLEADVYDLEWHSSYENRHYNLMIRLEDKRDDVLRFCTDFRAPFDNNQAERDIRMVKLQQKISGSWRSLEGAKSFCAVRSYVSTLRKNGQDILGGVGLLFDGHAWMPGGT
jgi:transposase